MTLEEWRKQQGLTQAELADRLGLESRQSVYRYEKGQLPRRTMLNKIKELTDGKVTANDFF